MATCELKTFTVKPPRDAAALFGRLMTEFKRACDGCGFSFYDDPNYAYQHPAISSALDRAMKGYSGEVAGQMIVIDGELMFRITTH